MSNTPCNPFIILKNFIKRNLAKFLWFEIKAIFGEELYQATIGDNESE